MYNQKLKLLKVFITKISIFSCSKKRGTKFILSVSHFTRQRLNSFKILALVSLFIKLFHVIAPLTRMEFLIKFVSGLGRMMFSFLLRPEFLCRNKSLNSARFLFHINYFTITEVIKIIHHTQDFEVY